MRFTCIVLVVAMAAALVSASEDELSTDFFGTNAYPTLGGSVPLGKSVKSGNQSGRNPPLTSFLGTRVDTVDAVDTKRKKKHGKAKPAKEVKPEEEDAKAAKSPAKKEKSTASLDASKAIPSDDSALASSKEAVARTQPLSTSTANATSLADVSARTDSASSDVELSTGNTQSLDAAKTAGGKKKGPNSQAAVVDSTPAEKLKSAPAAKKDAKPTTANVESSAEASKVSSTVTTQKVVKPSEIIVDVNENLRIALGLMMKAREALSVALLSNTVEETEEGARDDGSYNVVVEDDEEEEEEEDDGEF